MSVIDITPSVAGALSAADSSLFVRYPSRVSWNEDLVPAADQAAFRDLRNRLKIVSNWVVHELAPHRLQHFVSNLNPNGRTPKDLWCCVLSTDAPNKSYALQAALIVADDGIEICLCLGSGESQLSGDKRAEALAYLESVQDALQSAPEELVEAVDAALPDNARYLTSWRNPSAEPAFDTLREWLDHAGGPEGPQAAISVHFRQEDVDDAGQEIAETFLQMATAALPLFEFIESERVSGGANAVPAMAAEHQPFTWKALKELAQGSQHGLALDDEVYRATVAALDAGKHIIFTGAPGTAKTTLAELTAELAQSAGKCDGFSLTTATADWTTYETIGGLHPKADGSGGLEFQPGHFVEAVTSRRWLIIDELNRSNFDRAFGQMFSILSGQSVALPYRDPSNGKRLMLTVHRPGHEHVSDGYHAIPIPESWRIIATMNVFDKSLLFELSYALMRRFAFIEVPTPAESIYERVWVGRLHRLETTDREQVSAILRGLLKVRRIKDVGPAVFIDMARFAEVYVLSSDAWSPEELTFQLFYSYLLPQFEGIDDTSARGLFKLIRPYLGPSLTERLRVTLNTVLGVDLPSKRPSEEDWHELDDLG